MHVLMTLDRGVFTYATDLIAGLSHEGVSVSVASFGPALSDGEREELDRAGANLVEETGVALEPSPATTDGLTEAADALRELERSERPDVVHANGLLHGAHALETPVVAVAHCDALSSWRATFGCAAPEGWSEHREAVATAIRAAGAVIAPSRAMRSALICEYGTVARRVRVIHHGSPRPAAPADETEPFALAAAPVWGEVENLAVLREAAAKMRHQVVVAGEVGREARSGGAMTVGVRRGLVRSPAPLLLGAVTAEDLAALRRRAAAFVAPAWYEPFGLSILEAARGGCALVLADIPSLREVWDDAALFVSPGEPDRLARTLDLVLGKRGLALSLGQRAQRHAERYSSIAMTAAYLRSYGGVLAAAGGHRQLA
jgi:glycosyltransferase involved in cell wall biosynthesis